jgi:predicted enzyme related to lactoylglutathione lyase
VSGSEPGSRFGSRHLSVSCQQPIGGAQKHKAAFATFQALVNDGIPLISFGVDDVHAEYKRLQAVGVRFTQPPVDMGPVTTAVLDDTCGNLIEIAAKK